MKRMAFCKKRSLASRELSKLNLPLGESSSSRVLQVTGVQTAHEVKAAEQEALGSAKKAEKGTAKLEKRRGEQDNGRELPWQALGENAAAQATVKDLAEALYGIVSKHSEPEDVLYTLITMHRKDASNGFKAALQAFGTTWNRATKGVEKIPA